MAYNARELTGFHIYHLHEKNQTIYYDMFTKTGYIITNANVGTFSSWQLRLPLSIMLGAALVLLKVNPWLSILIGFLSFVISTILFHKLFLINLPINSNFVKPKGQGFFKDIAARYPKRILYMILIMFLAMAVVMIVNQLITKATGSARTITFVFTTISLIAAGLMTIVILIKEKNNL